MKVLLTGANGYIGKRLLPKLVSKGHKVYCCVRDINRFSPPDTLKPHIVILELDLLNPESLTQIPEEIDVAYYLVHSMSYSGNYASFEQQSAFNFRQQLNKTTCKQVIYLGGIINDKNLSDHLASRKAVELELNKGNFSVTTLRAGIIIGSGSASFEIIRDLVEKLPIMITPKWLNTKCQPIAIANAVNYLLGVAGNVNTYGKSFDIGGPDILTYKQMLLLYAKVRKLKRRIYTVPVMTPRLSSYWLYFVTSTTYKLAVALVDSMKVEVVCKDVKIKDIINQVDFSYVEALERAFSKIENYEIESSWKDSFSSTSLNINISDFIQVPSFGCFKDIREREINDKEVTLEKIWNIGGETGWYAMNWLWKLRGGIDKVFGGVGLRRGRTNVNKINIGDSIDFWRVIYANKAEGRLLLFAEMKLPGDAWLEFKIINNSLFQIATFRPKGLAGRLYWFFVLPFHGLVFRGMINALVNK